MDRFLTATLVAAGLIVLDQLAPPAPLRRRKRPSLAGLGEEDVTDEPEPPGIEYDDELPCAVPQTRSLNPEGGSCVNPELLRPRPRTSRPMARPQDDLIWPVRTSDPKKVRVSYQDVREKWHGKWGRHFGASRKGDDGVKRYHAGIDLYAEKDDTVQAMAPGEIVGILPFHRGTYAVYVQHDEGPVVNYGEVEPDSWMDFGIRSGVNTGQRVEPGQPLARVGKMRKSSMLHLETYRAGTPIEEIRQGKLRWVVGQPAPENLLDPTEFLLAAQNTWVAAHQPKA